MSNDSSSTEGMGLISALVFAMLVLILYLVDEIATLPWAAFRYVESYLWTHVFFFLPDYIGDTHEQLREYLTTIKWVDLDWSHVFNIERVLSYTSTWLYLLPIIRYFYIVKTKKRLYDRLRKRLGFEELLEIQSRVWRHTRYLIKHNPAKITNDINASPFAIRASVLHGLKRMKILRADRDNGEVIFDEDVAIKEISKQLRYVLPTDLNELDIIHKFFICNFGLRLPGLPQIYTKSEIKSANNVLKKIRLAQYILSFIPLSRKLPLIKKLNTNLDQARIFYGYGDFKNERFLNMNDFNETFRASFVGDISFHYNDELDFKYIKRHIDHIFPQIIENEKFKVYQSQHAYVETLLRRLQREGRSIGKLPPNHYSWLKMIDRQLWYALCDEGLPGSSIEAVGVHSHFQLELKSGIKSYFPNVNQAIISFQYPKTIAEFDRIKTLNQHPLSLLYPDDPELDKVAHDERLANDSDYMLQQMIINDKV